MDVRFRESDSSDYRDRTIYNVVNADITAAFAFDFDSPGEKLTRNAAFYNKRPYCAVTLPQDREMLHSWDFAMRSAERIASSLDSGQRRRLITLNVAGNGITSVRPPVTQEDLDVYMARTLMCLQRMVRIGAVRSGGQTGLDEAGVKAASAIGIPAEICAPKGWRMRTAGADGRYAEVYDEARFKERFSRTGHLDALSQIERQMASMGIADEEALVLFRGEPVNLIGRSVGNVEFGECLLELDQGSSGADRLWIGDDTLADFLRDHGLTDVSQAYQRNESSEPHKPDVYFVFKVAYSEYMSDSISYASVLASDADSAERKVVIDHVSKLVDGTYYPEVYSSIPESVVIDGRGYVLSDVESHGFALEGEFLEYFSHRDPDFINVWYSSGENAALSNFYPRTCSAVAAGKRLTFDSVEQGFQYLKTLKKYSAMPDEKRQEYRDRILSTTDGAELKRIGRSIPGLDTAAWGFASRTFMKELLQSAFENDPVGREQLLSTGDMKITHLQETGVWRNWFPELLMKTRSSLRVLQETRETQEYVKVSKGFTSERTGEPVSKSGPSFYEGQIEPSTDVVFVFGSNVEGRHGLGAAKIAREQFGAVYGKAEGLQGSSYGIPTKDLRVKENKGYRSVSMESITESIRKMYAVARKASGSRFMVAYRNGPLERSLSGYTGREMISMFLKAGPIPSNVFFSSEWKEEMQRQMSPSKGMKR